MGTSNSSHVSNQRAPPTRSPLKRRPVQTYRNDVSPLRGGKFLQR